jgi:hypothetical protein
MDSVSLEIERVRTMDCPHCGKQVRLSLTKSGDRMTMHSRPLCAGFLSSLLSGSDGLRKTLCDVYARMDRGDA